MTAIAAITKYMPPLAMKSPSFLSFELYAKLRTSPMINCEIPTMALPMVILIVENMSVFFGSFAVYFMISLFSRLL